MMMMMMILNVINVILCLTICDWQETNDHATRFENENLCTVFSNPIHTDRKEVVFFLFIVKPTRCTHFSNLFWKWNSTCFGQFLCPSSGVICCTLRMVYVTQVCRQLAVPSWSCSKAVYKPVWHTPLLSVQWITPDDEQRNCPKHVEFHFQNKFEKLVYLVGFIIKKIVTMHGYVNVKYVVSCVALGQIFSAADIQQIT
jgi:hypothetical protein